jgi:integrase
VAHIRKTKNGKFQATVSLGRDHNGKQIRKYITRSTEKECRNAAKKLEIEFDEGKFVNIRNIRTSKWLDEWLELNKNTLAPSTYMLYKSYIKNHYKPEFGRLKLSQLNEIHMKRFINNKMQVLSPNTVRKLIFVLNKALRSGLKGKNPLKDIKPPPKQKTRFRLITEKEFKKIHKEAKKNIFDECIILLSAWGGLRRGEIFALKPDDIDTDNKIIIVDEARTISENGYVDKRPKSENSIREIKIPAKLANLLKEYKITKGKIEDRFFSMRPDHYSHRFKKIVNATDIKDKDIVFHDLRHYHASWLYKNKAPDLYAAERLGHDINTLKKVYQHLDTSLKEEYDNKIINMIK